MPKYEVEVKRTGKLIVDAKSAELARINAEYYGNNDVDWEDWFSAEHVQPCDKQGSVEAEELEQVIASQVAKRVETEQQETTNHAPLVSADVRNWFGPYFRGELTEEEAFFAGVEIEGDWQEAILHTGDIARVLITTRGSLITEWILPCYQTDSKAMEAVKRAEARLTALYEKVLATYYKEAYAEIRHCGDCPQYGICSMQAIYYPRMVWIRDSYFKGVIPGLGTPTPKIWDTLPKRV